MMVEEDNKLVVDVKKDLLFDREHFVDNDDKLRLIKSVSPVVFFALNSDGEAVVVDPFNADERLKVDIGEVQFDNTNIATAGTATFSATERIEVLGFMGDVVMDANVANRNINMVVSQPPIVGPALLPFVSSAVIVLTASDTGGFLFPGGNSPNHWTNTTDAGVNLVANENPVPFVLEASGTIAILSDNDQVADNMGVGVWFRAV